MKDSPLLAIFTEALQLTSAERADYLERACGNDNELRLQIEALLQAHGQAGEFLAHSPQGIPTETASEPGAGVRPGDHIGRFKLLQQIGEGGCGVVFMAEQDQPVRRRVALKIIKPGMDSKSVIARFEAERQALALMDHPNIAKIFEAGETDSGRPYFVMELVRGVKITEYCDHYSLTTAERLKLFVQVCQAIQHAHQKGIIHRDIKPSNILVTTTIESAPLPVVIDFGIAKATTHQRLTDKTIFTAFEMLVGTPAYMSPEQAELTGLDVDTRTDIYSLGVLLYELLTGSTPFDSAELVRAGLDEIRRVIREQDPVRPSTRLSKLTEADLTTVAQRRRSEPPKLIRAVRGDLDWIAMKSLEKDRARRYETANDMALDVQRYLAHETISARPPSKFYKFKKTVMRHRLLFIGIAILALLLVSSLVIVSASLAREREARNLADAALRRAEADKANAQTASIKSQQVTKFLENMLQSVGPSVARGRDTTLLREVLDQTAESIGKEMTNQPTVEAELCNLIGALYLRIGNYDRAEAMQRLALSIDREIYSPESKEAAETLRELGLALDKEGKLPEAESVQREALGIRRRLSNDKNPDVATSINDLATVLRHQYRLAEAEALTRESLGIRQELFGDQSLEVADTLHNLSVVLGDEGKKTESETAAREMLAIRRKLLPGENLLVASALNDLAWALGLNGKSSEAESLQREALAMQLRLLGDDNLEVAKTSSSLGERAREAGKLLESEELLNKALSIRGKHSGENNPDFLYTLNSLGATLAAEGKYSEAENAYRRSLTAWRKLAGNENPQTLSVLNSLGSTLEAQGKWSEAESVWRESLAAWSKRSGTEDSQTMYTLRKLGLALAADRKWSEAEAVFREALAVSRKKGNQDPEALVDLERLVRILFAQEKLGEAEPLLAEVLTPAFASQPSSVNLLVQRVNLLGRRQRWQEAAADAALILEHQPDDHYHYHRLAGLLAVTDNRPRYEQLCRELLPKFNDTSNPYILERVADDCLLLPNSAVDLRLVDRVADAAVSRGIGNESMPYFQACKAMSDYRLGNFREAAGWAEKALESSQTNAQAKALAVLAMADWKLGQKDLARQILAKGEALAGGASEDLGESWVAWLFARISLNEAATLIKTHSLTPANSTPP
jgi:serine/threonine protein kinase/Tfp pilus assembly protein PilF